MKHLFVELSQVVPNGPAAVTVGSFDGVHLGHQQIIRQMVERARPIGLRPVAITFYPHPSVVLRGRQPPFYLTTPQERAELLGRYGVDLVVTYPFTSEVSHIRAADFVELLLRHVGMRELWAGPDFALGYKREGTVDFLRRLGEERGFAVYAIDAFAEVDGQPVSSTRIRQALQNGKIEEANACLGRPFQVSGTVVPGDGRGRQIGIPTANLEVWPERLLPERGVYATYAWVDGRRYPAATNIGIRPTFEGSVQQTVEAHFLDFSGDLYGRTVLLDFIHRLRPEQKFPGIEALIAQIRADVRRTRELL